MTRHRSPAFRVLRHQARACARPVSGTAEKCPIDIEVRSYAARDYDQCGHYLWPCVRSTSPLASPYPVPSGLARSREHGTGRAGNPSQRFRCGSAEISRHKKLPPPEGDCSLTLGMRGMMSASSATGCAFSWFPIGLVRKGHAA